MRLPPREPAGQRWKIFADSLKSEIPLSVKVEGFKSIPIALSPRAAVGFGGELDFAYYASNVPSS